MASYGDYCDTLLKEQGYTCCYCGCRIPHKGLPHFILEHLIPINSDKTLVGEYRNMMIACDGGEKDNEE